MLGLPIRALENEQYESLYTNMKCFNAIQSECFAALYRSDTNVFIAAPSCSGKTVCAELAMLRIFKKKPNGRCLYITAQEDAVQTKYEEWTKSFRDILDKAVVNLTANTSLLDKSIDHANIIVASAKNWDIFSRKCNRRYAVENFQLFIADDLHLIGSHQNGATLEVICSRMLSNLDKPIRTIGLSYSLHNALDVGNWLACPFEAFFKLDLNRRLRPVHIDVLSFDMTNNATELRSKEELVYNKIIEKSPDKPVIVFIPTMYEVEQTASKLRELALADVRMFYRHRKVRERYAIVDNLYYQLISRTILDKQDDITNDALKKSLPCGIGFIHEALSSSDRRLMKDMFSNQQLQILLVSQSLCWTIAPDAYLVIVMDTQFQNRKDEYNSGVDLIQMVGRTKNTAYFETTAIIFCQSDKAKFIKEFLLKPLTLESDLHHQLQDHFNAEIVNKSIENKKGALSYLTRTFLYTRMTKNPEFYNLQGTTNSERLSKLVENVLNDLENKECIAIKDDFLVAAIKLGTIIANYDIHYKTIELFLLSLKQDSNVRQLLDLICSVDEFGNLPMRHGEHRLTDPQTEANLLLQDHLARIPISSVEQKDDSNKTLIKCASLIQAIIVILSSKGWLDPVLASMKLDQMITQGQWHLDSILKQIPHFDNPEIVAKCDELGLSTVFDIMKLQGNQKFYEHFLTVDQCQEVVRFLQCYPNIVLTFNATKTVKVTENVVVAVTLTRDSENIGLEVDEVHAPYFPSPKAEHWWLLVGDCNQSRLLSIVLLTSETDNVELKFQAPQLPGLYKYVLHFVSDSYLGCDQMYDFDVNVV